MTWHFPRKLIVAACLCGLTLAKAKAQSSAALPPEDGKRDLTPFEGLLARSPFVMPSSSVAQNPISQRYVITGVARINDEPRIYLLDQTTQNRFMISPTQRRGDVELVSLETHNDPSRVRAVIRAGSDTGVVGFGKAAPSSVTTSGTQTAAATPAQADPAASPAATPPMVATRPVIRREKSLPLPATAEGQTPKAP